MPSHHRSKYDLINAWNYLRLAYQSMSEDQDVAIEVVAKITGGLFTPEARINALSQIIVRKGRDLIRGKEPLA